MTGRIGLLTIATTLAAMTLTGCITTPPGRRGIQTTEVTRRVAVYYATDREVVSGTRHNVKYGTKRAYTHGADPYHLGVCKVEIRRERSYDKPSMLPRSSVELVRVLSTTELERWSFYDRVRENMWNADANEIIVFVHGFNNDFDDAVKRTAELWFDLGFPGPPILYSWPSKGGMTGYFADLQTVEWSAAHLKRFLLQLVDETTSNKLMADRPARIHLVAHSMGCRALTLALDLIADGLWENDEPIFCDVVLAAPDVDRDVLRDVILPNLFRASVAEHYTLYASPEDVALQASQSLQYYPRAGSAAKRLLDERRDDFDTIDTSAVLVKRSDMKHDYFVTQPQVLRDMIQLLIYGDRDPGSAERAMWRKSHASPEPWMMAEVEASP